MASNLAVARVWASDKGKFARSSNGNLWCDGSTLYSYSTPIANIVTDALGRRVVLHWAHQYSMTTTGKHRTAVFRAWGYVLAWQVPTIGVGGGRKLLATVNHEINVAELQRAITEEEARLSRARSYTSRDHLDRLRVDLSSYRNAFKLGEA